MKQPSKKVRVGIYKKDLQNINADYIIAKNMIAKQLVIIKKRIKTKIPTYNKLLNMSDKEISLLSKDIKKYILLSSPEIWNTVLKNIDKSYSKGMSMYNSILSSLGSTVVSGIKKGNGYKTASQFVEWYFTKRKQSKSNIRYANAVTEVVENAIKNGKSLQEMSLLLEKKVGLKTKYKGKAFTRPKGYVIASGRTYEYYRIIRTETMRMRSASAVDSMRNMDTTLGEKRLKLLAVIDSRTRQQSISMDGQISDKLGKFRYPNGYFYKYNAPARYMINDRETTYPVLLDS